VTKGYYNNSIANIKSFKNGWFCTGDLGYIDEDGYLFIKGRIKELINRAGEKISPREVDEVLYSLSVVEMAAAVGVPDSFYGEEVVAFIKLKSGKKIEEQEIMDFCKNYLADFKIPKKIFFIDDFPKGPSGKIQRKKLVNTYINMKKLEKRRDLYEKNS
jgi:acyl-CoA synthetase (AMP-forming)/AMP-acid ligase II